MSMRYGRKNRGQWNIPEPPKNGNGAGGVSRKDPAHDGVPAFLAALEGIGKLAKDIGPGYAFGELDHRAPVHSSSPDD